MHIPGGVHKDVQTIRSTVHVCMHSCRSFQEVWGSDGNGAHFIKEISRSLLTSATKSLLPSHVWKTLTRAEKSAFIKPLALAPVEKMSKNQTSNSLHVMTLLRLELSDSVSLKPLLTVLVRPSFINLARGGGGQYCG